LLARTVADLGYRVEHLPSGAGHDAAELAGITPIAMLFVRCPGGISHNPAESVSPGDVAAAIEAMGRFLVLVAETRS
jgi:acetylornithine deacetylase/succinyl-diaminopimelate desuccinylase-like protein